MKVRDRYRHYAQVLCRALQTENHTPYFEKIDAIEGSRLGRLRITRQCLDKAKWEDVISPPRWWVPPYDKRNG